MKPRPLSERLLRRLLRPAHQPDPPAPLRALEHLAPERRGRRLHARALVDEQRELERRPRGRDVQLGHERACVDVPQRDEVDIPRGEPVWVVVQPDDPAAVFGLAACVGRSAALAGGR